MFYVYVLSNRTGKLSAGVTPNIARHLELHQQSIAPGCTHKHQYDRLLLLETFRHSNDAAARAEEVNRCALSRKLEIIRATNPRFEDLSATVKC